MAISGSIKVTPEKMLALSSQLRDVAHKISYDDAQLDEILVQLNSSWEGETKDAFIHAARDGSNFLKKFCAMIIEHADELETMSKVYQSAEQANSDMIFRLDIAGIV